MKKIRVEFDARATRRPTEEIHDAAAAQHLNRPVPGLGLTNRFDNDVGAAAAQAEGFTGTWDTTFGPVTLIQKGRKVTGSYYDGKARLQGTAEGAPFTREQMSALMDLASSGISRLIELQRAALK